MVLVVIGASWGGLEALQRVLGALPEDFEAALIVVQHRAAGGPDRLAHLLDARSALPVREAEDKDPLRPGCVRVAPAGYHLLVDGDTVALSTEGAVRHSRPSIDVTLESAALAFGRCAVGVVLTGANEDGAAGLATLRARGGFAIVQDPEEAVRSEMPAAATALAHPEAVVVLDDIAPLLVRVSHMLERAVG